MTPEAGRPRTSAAPAPGKAKAARKTKATLAKKPATTSRASPARKPASAKSPSAPGQPQPSSAAPQPPSIPPQAPRPPPPTGPWTHMPANVRYVQVPQQWVPAGESLADRVSRTDVRLALAFLLTGAVAVFLRQMPLLAQVVFGAPLFEEAFKLGLALLPCALLKARTLALRLPAAAASGAGFGWLEHTLTYSDETQAVEIGRLAFHALSTILSMLVLHGLSQGGDRRLRVACTIPSSVVHAANNTSAILLALADAAGLLSVPDSVALGLAAGFVVVLFSAVLTWPFWHAGYRRALEDHVLPRGTVRLSPSTSSRS